MIKSCPDTIIKNDSICQLNTAKDTCVIIIEIIMTVINLSFKIMFIFSNIPIFTSSNIVKINCFPCIVNQTPAIATLGFLSYLPIINCLIKSNPFKSAKCKPSRASPLIKSVFKVVYFFRHLCNNE